MSREERQRKRRCICKTLAFRAKRGDIAHYAVDRDPWAPHKTVHYRKQRAWFIARLFCLAELEDNTRIVSGERIVIGDRFYPDTGPYGTRRIPTNPHTSKAKTYDGRRGEYITWAPFYKRKPHFRAYPDHSAQEAELEEQDRRMREHQRTLFARGRRP